MKARYCKFCQLCVSLLHEKTTEVRYGEKPAVALWPRQDKDKTKTA